MAKFLDHTDTEKVTYICPSCDAPYFQCSRGEWYSNVVKWDRKAKRYLVKSHKCWWKTKHQADIKHGIPAGQIASLAGHNAMLDSAEHEYLTLKREKQEEEAKEMKQAMAEASLIKGDKK